MLIRCFGILSFSSFCRIPFKHINIRTQGRYFWMIPSLYRKRKVSWSRRNCFTRRKQTSWRRESSSQRQPLNWGKRQVFFKSKGFTSHFSLSHTYFHGGFVLNEYNYQIFLTDMGKLSYLK